MKNWLKMYTSDVEVHPTTGIYTHTHDEDELKVECRLACNFVARTRAFTV